MITGPDLPNNYFFSGALRYTCDTVGTMCVLTLHWWNPAGIFEQLNYCTD